jgi:acetolactate synthase-1/2/3 large subunit
MISIMERLGVSTIFGLPGGAAIPLFDALVDSKIKLVLTRHEQGAAFMADGYARATGKPGVVLVTSGPGATNTITGILTAHMDSVPMVVICGQQTRPNLGLDTFQEADVSGISYPVVKHSYLVREPADVKRIMEEAFYLAGSGRPGPVLIDMPKDVSSSMIEAPQKQEEHHLPGYDIPGQPDVREIERAAEFLHRSRRPLLLVGHGAVISGAGLEVRRLAEKLPAPVTNTLLGKGCFPETHELSLGMLGMHGTAYANKAVAECDLIMSIGSRWDDRIVGNIDAFCPEAVKIHIDIDPAEFDKTVQVDSALLGDARQVVQAIESIVQPGDTAEWLERICQWKRDFPLAYTEGEKPRAQHVIEELYRLTRGKAVVATDVGQHQMWAAQFYRVDHRFHWITSGGAGSMGFGFPAAIGAQLARPDALVAAIVGDGGFQMTMSELSTAVNEKLPLKIILLNNRYLGMVRQWQNLFYRNRLSGVDLKGNPDFVRLAESYGCKALRIEKSSQVREVLQQALDYTEGPCLVDAEVEKEDNVFPMIPAGGSANDMILGPTEKGPPAGRQQ